MNLFKLPFKSNKQATPNTEEDSEIKIQPKHVAIIMDGNGRWAQKRGLPRIAGHREGMDNVKRIVKAANKFHIEVLTLYAFSTENWKRPSKEVEYLMKLPVDFLQHYLPELIEENVQIQTIGEVNKLPPNTYSAIMKAKERTVQNTGLILNIAINYGSRNELIQSIKQICEDVKEGDQLIQEINESTIAKYLSTATISDPDLLIRTSGELRLSNFLLWQSAYTELWFTDTLWPDFNDEEFEKAILDFQKRKRRYGGI